ncbi:MAG: OmpA family protein, partial [candidate division WOR-3 bacterium]
MELVLFIILPIISVPQEIKFPLSYVKFVGESVQMEETSLSSLDFLAEFLRLTGAKIEIGGHTDNVGTPQEKQRLSEARAKAVCDYLKSKHKIPESNLIYKGYGPSMPIATNRTPEGRAKNNRIEIKILSAIPVAKLEFIKGKTSVNKGGISEPEEINEEHDLTLFDRLLTDSLGRVNIRFGGIDIKVFPNSDITLNDLNTAEKELGIYLKAGKIMARVSDAHLLITTPACTISTNKGEFLFESEMYYQDLLSVWSGSAKVTANDSSELVNENCGTFCYYGKKPASPKILPEPPALDTTMQEGYFEYNERNPFKFFFNKPGAKVHFIVGKDPKFDDVIYESVSESESCVVKSVDLPHIYLWLGSIDESGL